MQKSAESASMPSEHLPIHWPKPTCANFCLPSGGSHCKVQVKAGRLGEEQLPRWCYRLPKSSEQAEFDCLGKAYPSGASEPPPIEKSWKVRELINGTSTRNALVLYLESLRISAVFSSQCPLATISWLSPFCTPAVNIWRDPEISRKSPACYEREKEVKLIAYDHSKQSFSQTIMDPVEFAFWSFPLPCLL